MVGTYGAEKTCLPTQTFSPLCIQFICLSVALKFYRI